jgi:hypothetical protein
MTVRQVIQVFVCGALIVEFGREKPLAQEQVLGHHGNTVIQISTYFFGESQEKIMGPALQSFVFQSALEHAETNWTVSPGSPRHRDQEHARRTHWILEGSNRSSISDSSSTRCLPLAT